MLGGMKKASVQAAAAQRSQHGCRPETADQRSAPSAEPSLFIYTLQARLVHCITDSLHGQKAVKACLNAGHWRLSFVHAHSGTRSNGELQYPPVLQFLVQVPIHDAMLTSCCSRMAMLMRHRCPYLPFPFSPPHITFRYQSSVVSQISFILFAVWLCPF